jgi:F0F1-type ATP synthase membrane subunit b/b'
MNLWQLVLIQAGMFVGLFVVLRALFYRHLNAALRRLQDLQEQALAKEAQLKDELRRAQEERTTEVEKGAQEARRLIEAAKHEAETLRLNAEEQAKHASQTILTRTQEELERRRANLVSEIETEALHFSTEMIRYTLTQDGKGTFQRHLIDELIDDLERVEHDRFMVAAESVTVTSSLPLTDQERRRLRQVLSTKVGTEVALVERLDPELISGLVIRVGALVIDGSLRNKLRKAIPLVRKSPSSEARDHGEPHPDPKP